MGNLSLLEGFWILVNTITLAFVVGALSDARATQSAAELLKAPPSRVLVVAGDVRNEILRLVKVLILMTIAIPGIFFADGEVRPAPFRVLPIVALIGLALLLLAQSFIDARARKRLLVLVTAEALEVKTNDLAELRDMLVDNTRISQEASDHADKAYHEANSVNEKIASQGAAIFKQGETMDADRAHNAASRGTIETTAAEVHDLHEGDAPAGAK